MVRAKKSFSIFTRMILGTLLQLGFTTSAAAQHHGGHGMAGSIPGGSTRPTGLDEKDSLKDFHQALAVQATSEQIAEFQEIVKSTNTLKDKLSAFLGTGDAAREGVTPLDQALERARSGSKKFQDGFSQVQKSGLKEFTKRLEKADSELGKEGTRLDQTVQAEAAKPEVLGCAESLSKALTAFASEQLALGREMGITLASGDDLTFTLPPVQKPVVFGNLNVSVAVSGELSQSSVEGDLRTFKIEMTEDLSDLQQNVSEIMKTQLDEGRTCGKRLAVQQASIMAAAPASSLILRLHFERWSCSPAFGQSSANELAENDGTVEVKLTPAVEKSSGLKLNPEYKRIDAGGMLGEELRSGDLGADLLSKIAKSMLSAVQAGADFNTTLPTPVQAGATIQSARFQDSGAGGLRVVVEGQTRISNEQAKLLANQLNQTLSAQGKPAQ